MVVTSLNLSNDANARRALIMKHYSTPNNKGELDNSKIVELHSQVCVDHLVLNLIIENDVIKDVKFQGEGCAIFLSSVDIMIDIIKGKTIDEVKDIIKNYEFMLHNSEKYDDNLLQELTAFANAGSHLNRLHCAEMIANALKKAIY